MKLRPVCHRNAAVAATKKTTPKRVPGMPSTLIASSQNNHTATARDAASNARTSSVRMMPPAL